MTYQIPTRSRRKIGIPIREFFLHLWKDYISGLSLKLTFGFIVFFILILLFYYWRLPPEIPLTYSRPWGVEQLVPKIFLFVLFALTMLIVASNSLLAAFLFEREKLLARILVWTSTLVNLLVVVTVFRVMILVT